MIDAEWEDRLAGLWATLDDWPEEEFAGAMDALAGELPDEAVALFERAAARDSTGSSDLAVHLYEQALARGLAGERRRRAVIQMASSLRNLGKSERSVALLEAELSAGPDDLDDPVRAFLALALADIGREREGLSLVLVALARHLPRYQRSVANYARLLVIEPQAEA